MSRPTRTSYRAYRRFPLKSVADDAEGGAQGISPIDGITEYSLIICEKPDAAKKIAAALAEEGVRSVRLGGVEVLIFSRKGQQYVACSALGHLYGLADCFRSRETYPVFDLEWFPAHVVNERSTSVRSRIKAIERLARRASSFIDACDYDIEGATIGENILRYACGCPDGEAARAKFSTLTRDDLVSAFDHAMTGTGSGLALAGRARHALDFLWGVNLSRVLSLSFNLSSSGYRTISMGRVQGPTLGFVVEREIEIRNFVPAPYWTVVGTFEKDGIRFQAPSSRGKLVRESDAFKVKADCEGAVGMVSAVSKSVYREGPPPPFDTSDLQREAYRVFGYPPWRTLQIAQRLYLDASISYPRTGSQKLPPSIRYDEIISRLSHMDQYSAIISVVGRRATPREGVKTDPAHPAIYPTGEHLRRAVFSQEGKVFDLIVRRFLSCFGEDAVKERTDIQIDVGGHPFAMVGRRTLSQGWTGLYGKYSTSEEQAVPEVELGGIVQVSAISCEEKMESPPPRYNQSSLLGEMEREEIGTKATRAETISILLNRGYVSGEQLTATDLGMALVENMEENCPRIISTELTRQTERDLEGIEGGSVEYREVLERAINLLSTQVEVLRTKAGAMPSGITEEVLGRREERTLGQCPVCRTGKIIIIRSRKTGKRFAGCSNYRDGCRASAPLPQRGSIRAAAKACSKCGWPVVYVRTWRRPWRLCINTQCDNKGGRRNHAVQTLQKRGSRE